jgi:trehalose 6-phosphate synthase/phosphatase
MSEPRLLVVSNRLPLTIGKEGDTWRVKPSSGGLATAMEPILKKKGGSWIGWSGDDGELDSNERNQLLQDSSSEFTYVPVNFPAGAGRAFYEGYPNQTVWPLFHLFPSRMLFDPDSWKPYVQGNEVFATAVAEHAKTNDLVWIHDYHLMLLPGIVREQGNDVKIGFFLHIPFPSSEVFSILPRGGEVLRGLLGADLIAFHTHRDLHHFRSSLSRILGLETGIDRVEYEGRTIRLEALPIGIAPKVFADLTGGDPETASRIAEVRSRYAGRRLIIAVDRLDYSKGIPERFRAFRRLLRCQPSLREQAVLIQVAVPSREGIGEYQALGSEINELVGEINGEFGTADWTPIVYLRHSVDRPELAALYAAAEVAWVTPLRDGMNLVAKEYCACKPDGDGVLILSQFAGAAAEMGESLLVNPFDEEQVAGAVMKALFMPREEQAVRMRALRERVIRNDVFKWAEGFIEKLSAAGGQEQAPSSRLDFPPVVSAYKNASRRILILDYDGTLVDIGVDPEKTSPPAHVHSALSKLAEDGKNVVAVLSGRRAADLDRWLGTIPNLILGAEHGMLIRNPQSTGWESLRANYDPRTWKPQVRMILEQFTDRAPGSFVEEKEYSLVWHFRRVEPEFGSWLAGELSALLSELLADTDARPVLGRKIVEVRPMSPNKGDFALHLLNGEGSFDFQLAAGDDSTDEDIFDKLNSEAFTIHVGRAPSRARYRLNNPASVARLLSALLGK